MEDYTDEKRADGKFGGEKSFLLEMRWRCGTGFDVLLYYMARSNAFIRKGVLLLSTQFGIQCAHTHTPVLSSFLKPLRSPRPSARCDLTTAHVSVSSNEVLTVADCVRISGTHTKNVARVYDREYGVHADGL